MHTSKATELDNFDYRVSNVPPGTMGTIVTDDCGSECYGDTRSNAPDSTFYLPSSYHIDELSISESSGSLDVDDEEMTNDAPAMWTDEQDSSDESGDDLSTENSDTDSGNFIAYHQRNDAPPAILSVGDRRGTSRPRPAHPVKSSSVSFTYSDAELKKIAELRRCPHKLNEPSYSPLILRMVVPPHKEDFLRNKSSSTSTLFMNSTIEAPNNDEITRCMSLTIYWNILSFESKGSPNAEKQIFSEKYYPLDCSVNCNLIPSQDAIYRFLKSIFTAENLSAECGVMVIAYIDRMQTLAGVSLTRSTWRRVCLGCIILASKVWEDQAVWNADFLKLFPSIEVNELNRLEREVLRALQFNVSLKASVYAKYYFELRSLSEKDAQYFPVKPLDKLGAKRLEESSQGVEVVARRTRKRSVSVDYRDGAPFTFTPALIS